MLWWFLSGETLDRGGPEIYPYSFLCTRPHRWTFCFILVYLGHIYMEKQRLCPLYHEIGSGRPIVGVYTYRSSISAIVNSPCLWRRPCPGPIYIACTNLPSQLYTYIRDHSCKFRRVYDTPVVFIRRKPRPGGPEIYPYSFLRTRPHQWIFCFILVYLGHIYIYGKQRLGPLTMK
jgi:hypothetical protein